MYQNFFSLHSNRLITNFSINMIYAKCLKFDEILSVESKIPKMNSNVIFIFHVYNLKIFVYKENFF